MCADGASLVIVELLNELADSGQIGHLLLPFRTGNDFYMKGQQTSVQVISYTARMIFTA